MPLKLQSCQVTTQADSDQVTVWMGTTSRGNKVARGSGISDSVGSIPPYEFTFN